MEIKFMGTRIEKLMWILIKIIIMFLIMTGMILINRKYISNAEGNERKPQQISSERLPTSEEISEVALRYFISNYDRHDPSI